MDPLKYVTRPSCLLKASSGVMWVTPTAKIGSWICGIGSEPFGRGNRKARHTGARRNRYLRKIPAPAKGCSALSLHSACFGLNFRGVQADPCWKTGGPRSGPLTLPTFFSPWMPRNFGKKSICSAHRPNAIGRSQPRSPEKDTATVASTSASRGISFTYSFPSCRPGMLGRRRNAQIRTKK